MKFREFKTFEDLESEALALLKKHLAEPIHNPHAVMLSGGKTPFGIFDKLSKDPVATDNKSHLILADERYVPFSSEESNYGRMKEMISALNLDASQVINIDTTLDIQEAADNYNEKLKTFIDNDGEITLGFLGLGTDGHTASLFSMDLLNDTGRYAIAVPCPEQSRRALPACPPKLKERRRDSADRISVTKELLKKCELLIFLVAGEEKINIIKKIQSDPKDIIAGCAVEEVENVELWYSFSD